MKRPRRRFIAISLTKFRLAHYKSDVLKIANWISIKSKSMHLAWQHKSTEVHNEFSLKGREKKLVSPSQAMIVIAKIVCHKC